MSKKSKQRTHLGNLPKPAPTPMPTRPVVVASARYPGDVTKGSFKADLSGLRPLRATYDPDTDKTTVEFGYDIPVEE